MSAVTAVPIRPLARGSLLKLWVALAVLAIGGAALAWFGTGGLQRETTQSGLQYQVIEAGEGRAIGAEDVIQFHVTGRRADGTQILSSVGREPVTGTTSQGPIPGLGEALSMMREGSRYRVWMTITQAFRQPPPPESGVSPDELVSFDIQVLRVQSMAEMMRAMGGGMGMPGGAPGMAPPGAGGAPGDDPHAGLPPEMGAPAGPAPEAAPSAGNTQ